MDLLEGYRGRVPSGQPCTEKWETCALKKIVLQTAKIMQNTEKWN